MICISGLNYSYNGIPALQDIDLQISDGEFVAIIGPNGAGKSTLIRLVLGLLPLQSGSIAIDGQPHQQWLQINSLGYLPQREEFDRRFPATALDLVLMGLAGELGIGRRFNPKHKDRALQALATTSTADLANQSLGSLS